MKLVIDMNLSPEWAAVLERRGFDAVHWSSVGNARASDSEILAWARSSGRVVFTHDLGFGALVAAAPGRGPSVMQVRTQDVTPGHTSRTSSSLLSKPTAPPSRTGRSSV